LAALAQRSYDSGLQLLERGLMVYPGQGQVTDRMIAEALMAYAELNIGNPTHAKRLLFKSLNSAVSLQDPLALIVVIGVIALILLDQGDEYRGLCAWRVVWRLSPPLQKAAWIKKLYGERLGELFEALSADEWEEIEAHLQKNSLWDEANALLEYVTAENWGRPPRR